MITYFHKLVSTVNMTAVQERRSRPTDDRCPTAKKNDTLRDELLAGFQGLTFRGSEELLYSHPKAIIRITKFTPNYQEFRKTGFCLTCMKSFGCECDIMQVNVDIHTPMGAFTLEKISFPLDTTKMRSTFEMTYDPFVVHLHADFCEHKHFIELDLDAHYATLNIDQHYKLIENQMPRKG